MKNRSFRIEESQIRDLINNFNKGDKQSFGALWEGLSPYVYSLMKKGVDAPTAEDLTSEICVKLYEKALSQYRPKGKVSFKTWLGRLAANHKISAFKKKRPANFSDLSEDESGNIAEKIYSSGKTPLRILIEREDGEIRKRAFEMLPKLMERLSCREKLVLEEYFFRNRTDKEIAGKLSGKESDAPKYKMIRRRAVRKLENLFRMNGVKDFPVKS